MIKTAQLATIPGREKFLEDAIESLLPQMDKVVVVFNGFLTIPCLNHHPKLRTYRNEVNIGDRAKFQEIETHTGYLFTCDDDLIYPPDYASMMIDKIEQYQCAVTLHGKNYNPANPSFFKPVESFHCLAGFPVEKQVQVGGTGVMAWRSDMIDIRLTDFAKPNMADLYFARAAKYQGVKIMAIAHEKGYLGYNVPKQTIWDDSKKAGGVEQTELLRSFLANKNNAV